MVRKTSSQWLCRLCYRFLCWTRGMPTLDTSNWIQFSPASSAFARNRFHLSLPVGLHQACCSHMSTNTSTTKSAIAAKPLRESRFAPEIMPGIHDSTDAPDMHFPQPNSLIRRMKINIKAGLKLALSEEHCSCDSQARPWPIRSADSEQDC